MNARFGLIGEKLGHSHSPRVHKALAGYDYELVSLPRDEVDKFMRERGFDGINVTIPYKQTVIPYCDELSPEARAIGAVNTIVRRGDRLLGHNTDLAGLLYMARRAGVSFEGRKVVILGTGGTSLTALEACRRGGAREIARLSRTGSESYGGAEARHSDADVIVNTTPLGMYPKLGAAAIDLSKWQNVSAVLDVVYNPLRTALVLDARAHGLPSSCGLSMLVAQAKYAAELFAGRDIEDSMIDSVTLDIERDLTCLVIIGMPGSGKSSIGRRAAELLGREFVDTDDLIKSRIGDIPRFFAEHGEGRFREVESEIIEELAPRTGLVIATGGGVPLREANVRALRANGVLVRIKRPLDQLATDGRPLSMSRPVEQISAEREPYYSAAADAEADNESTVEAAAAEAIKKWESAIGR